MSLLLALLAQLLHWALILLAAPLLAGGARWLRLRLAGRRGAPPWQEWHDLRRLVAKQPNLPEHIVGVISCVNPRCVTTAEPGIKQMFHLVHSERLEYRCDYCDEEAKL